MRSIAETANLLITGILLQDAQLRAAGVRAEDRARALQPSVEAQLSSFQDQTLKSAEGATLALARALDFRGR